MLFAVLMKTFGVTGVLEFSVTVLLPITRSPLPLKLLPTVKSWLLTPPRFNCVVMLNKPVCMPPPFSWNSVVPKSTFTVPSLSKALLKSRRALPELLVNTPEPVFVNGTLTTNGNAFVAVIVLLLTMLPAPVIWLVLISPLSVQALTPLITRVLSSVNVSRFRFDPRSKPPLALRVPAPVKAND